MRMLLSPRHLTGLQSMQPQDIVTVEPVAVEPVTEEPSVEITLIQDENVSNPFDDIGLAPGVRKSNVVKCHLITIFSHTQTFSP